MPQLQRFWKILCTALLASLLLSALPMQARDTCAQRVRKAQARLNQAVRKHGHNSRQAAKRRHQLDRAYQCGRDRRL